MKKISLSILASLATLLMQAQSVPPGSIEDSVIGWMKVYHFGGVRQPVKVDARTYSPAQMSICDSLANWIQASYVPKGALGDVKRTVLPKLTPYNQYMASLPPSYGATAKIYFFLKKDPSGKLVPENSLGVSWNLLANAVPGWEIRDLCTPTQYFFTMPSFEQSSNSEAVEKAHDLRNLPPFRPYTNFWIKDMEGGGGTDFVLLSRNNRSPFIRLTKGEYLAQLERAIPRIYEEEKKKIYEKEQGNARNISYFMGYLDEKNQKRLANLERTKEKYKDRLGEIAYTGVQPSLNDLDNGGDVFSNGYLSDPESLTNRVPVYTLDSTMAALCKTDRPQWILMSWSWTPNHPVERHLHESIIHNFNLDYVYQFFFEPEKVKGQPYRPLRSPYFQEAMVVLDASQKAKDLTKDQSVFFFEDFSTTAPGKKPVGWKSKMGPDGTAPAVERVDGLEGNWTVMRNQYSLASAPIKEPLPQNFSLSFDLVASENFTWGAKGLSFQLSRESSPGNAESFLTVKLRPGSDGRDGETEIETKFDAPPGYLTGTKWYKAPGFSNNKKNNRIRVTIEKKEESLSVFIDQTKIVTYDKAIPAALRFNALSFSTGWLGAQDRYYISNLKITRP